MPRFFGRLPGLFKGLADTIQDLFSGLFGSSDVAPPDSTDEPGGVPIAPTPSPPREIPGLPGVEPPLPPDGSLPGVPFAGEEFPDQHRDTRYSYELEINWHTGDNALSDVWRHTVYSVTPLDDTALFLEAAELLETFSQGSSSPPFDRYGLGDIYITNVNVLSTNENPAWQ